jgi:hypothetical protein
VLRGVILCEVGVKKIARIIFEKAYWLLLAGIPFFPEYVLLKYRSALACNADGICFRYGYPSLNSEGLAIVNMSIALLFPMCAWQLLGKHVIAALLRSGRVEIFQRNPVIALFGKLYWLAIATIPLVYWYLFGTIAALFECVETSGCMEFYWPLDVPSRVAVLISLGLLWPMCFWKLFGKPRRLEKQGPE